MKNKKALFVSDLKHQHVACLLELDLLFQCVSELNLLSVWCHISRLSFPNRDYIQIHDFQSLYAFNSGKCKPLCFKTQVLAKKESL